MREEPSAAEYAYLCAITYVAGAVFAALSASPYLMAARTVGSAIFPATLKGEIAFLVLSCLGYSGVVMSFLRGASSSASLGMLFSALLTGRAPPLSLLIFTSTKLLLGVFLSAIAGAFAIALWSRSYGRAAVLLSLYALLSLAEIFLLGEATPPLNPIGGWKSKNPLEVFGYAG